MNSTRTVTTQAELDQAIKDEINRIDIRSEGTGVWLEVTAHDTRTSSTVRAYDSSTVMVHGSSKVIAYDSSTVTAYDSSTVMSYGLSTVILHGSSKSIAYDSSEVMAYDSSKVIAYDSSEVTSYGLSTVILHGSSKSIACGSSTIMAHGSSTVRAYDSSTVMSYGSPTVILHGSSKSIACDSSEVMAYGLSTVRAYDSSTVMAYDSSTVMAAPLVAVHLYSAKAHTKGGVILDHTHVDDMDGQAWCKYHGVEVKRGIATLFKAVNDKWTTARGTDYSPGSKPKCNDWNREPVCGGGLHFGPTPTHALDYHPEATKFVEVGVRVTDLVPIPGDTAKAKAPRVVRACVECDINGKVTPEDRVAG